MEDVFWWGILVGFAAQLIDGCLGMAYGVTSTSFLLGLGIPPAAASASVHAAEVFTTGVSGTFHLRFGNADKTLFRKLVVPGVIGGVVGAYVLTRIDGAVVKPVVAGYLLLMGALIIWRAVRKTITREVRTHLFPLGAVGGFFDAIGGGGWGPIVTTTLVARGNHTRQAVGSVNLAEFFVTVSQSITFLLAIGLTNWQVILGLMAGGVVAAPIAALLCRRLPSRLLTIMVGILIIGLSIRTIYLAF